MKSWIVFALLLTAVAYFYSHKNSASNPISSSKLTTTLTTYQKANAKIIVYSLPGHPMAYRALETLKMYGFDSELFPVNSIEDMKIIPNLPQDLTTVPIFKLPFNQLVSSEEFFSAVGQLSVVDFHPGKTSPYVIVYGISNCIYTQHAKEELDRAGIPYEYIDLNSDAPRYMGEVDARLQASGYQENSYQTPIIEVNGYMRPRLDISTVIEKYNTP